MITGVMSVSDSDCTIPVQGESISGTIPAVQLLRCADGFTALTAHQICGVHSVLELPLHTLNCVVGRAGAKFLKFHVVASKTVLVLRWHHAV